MLASLVQIGEGCRDSSHQFIDERGIRRSLLTFANEWQDLNRVLRFVVNVASNTCFSLVNILRYTRRILRYLLSLVLATSEATNSLLRN
jgi:hypothetical protein